MADQHCCMCCECCQWKLTRTCSLCPANMPKRPRSDAGVTHRLERNVKHQKQALVSRLKPTVCVWCPQKKLPRRDIDDMAKLIDWFAQDVSCKTRSIIMDMILNAGIIHIHFWMSRKATYMVWSPANIGSKKSALEWSSPSIECPGQVGNVNTSMTAARKKEKGLKP